MKRGVKNGKNFVIFPEGTRSKNGNNLLPFKGGSFKSTQKAKCPIVPCALIDSFIPFDENSVRQVTVKLIYLPPMYYEEYKDMKTTEITNDELKAGMQIADALVKAGLMKSKGEARRMIQQKGVYLNDNVVEDQFYELKESDFDANGEAIVRKGKKNYHRLKIG